MTEFEKAFEIIRILQEHGHEAIIVGGWVRDQLLGIESDDVDIATSALSHEIARLFPNCKQEAGTLFHVNIVEGIEVATYRYDQISEDGETTTLFAECFREDSERRDLTINAIGYDPIADKYIDHWNGASDLKNNLIRFVDVAQARIEEDPVRMLRAARFAAKIDGKLVPSAFFAIKDNAHLIDSIPRERIQKEILKALSTKKPSVFFEILQRTGLLKRIIPDLDDCWWHDGGIHHAEFVHEHLLYCCDYVESWNPIVRLAALLHDIGKIEAYDENDFTFINHEKFGTDIARDILTNLKFSTDIVEKVCSLILVHMRNVSTDTSPRACRRTLAKLEKHKVSLSDFLVLKIADRHANKSKPDYTQEEIVGFIKAFEDVANVENAAFSVKDLTIDGNDVLAIGVKRGPQIGKILNKIFEAVLEHPELNNRETLLNVLKGFVDEEVK